MATPHHSAPDDPQRAAHDDQPGTNHAPTTDSGRTPNHERWWWTGTFRAVLGAVIIGYQWGVVSDGQAQTANWVMVALGAAIALWGLWIVWQAWQEQRAPHRPH